MTKSKTPTSRRRRIARLTTATAGAGVLAFGVFSSLAGATAQILNTVAPVPAPAIPGAPPLPGPLATASSPAANMGIMRSTPDHAGSGAKFTLSAAGLPAGKQVSIIWSTSNVNWVLDARPDSVDYIGQKEDKNIQVVLATTTTDGKGAFDLTITVPRDFGGIHDLYAVIDGVQYAKGGFLVDRTLKIGPLKGPVGTPITVAVTGLGSSLYGGAASLWYDGHYAGVITGKWTRGEATVQIRAAGPVGRHIVLVGTGMQFNYLNIDQSPIPWATGGMSTFVVTKDSGPPATRVDWPASVAPTVDARTTLLTSTPSSPQSATVNLGSANGVVGAKVPVTAAGLAPLQPVTLELATVVGNRVNCSGTCWTFASVPLGQPVTAADGSLNASFQVPDGLGGWHVVRAIQGGQAVAQIPFYIKRSLISVPKTVKAGQPFQVHLKGVGWTQLDNTVAVTYDNSYIGYGCGFNSDGDVVLKLVATGEPGTHLIDIYPLLYPYQPAYAYPPHAAVPFLNFAKDYPGLALGYQLPAFRLAIRVVR